MTEYDYSPEAYERHIAKQQSIARWVDQQATEAQRYANPFVPSAFGGQESTRQPQHAQAQSYVTDRQRDMTRSFSTPPESRQLGSSASRHHRSHSHSHSHSHPRVHTVHLYSTNDRSNISTPTLVHKDGSRSHGSHSRSQSHSRSSSRTHSRPPPARSQNYTPNTIFSSSQTQLPAHQYHHGSTASRRLSGSTSALQYASSPGQPVVMHQGKQTYVVIPSRGSRVEVHSPHSVQAMSGPASAYPSLSSSKKAPLLKRIFNGGGSHSGTRRSDVTVLSRDSRRRTTSFF